MKQVEEKRTKTFRSEVKNTGIVINYRATLVPAETGEEVSGVYGTIVKENKNVGSVGYDKAPTVCTPVLNRFPPPRQRSGSPSLRLSLWTWPKSYQTSRGDT